MISVAPPIAIVMFGWMSGLPARPIAATSPFLRPMSALTMAQWSTMTALVITVSITSKWQRCD